MQVATAIAPFPAQGIVPVGGTKPGSPKARKSQEVMAEFVQVPPEPLELSPMGHLMG
jgi:hypothetical protein